jgi:hypothetical protein
LKYAVCYHSDVKYFSTVDEVILKYTSEHHRASLLDYVKGHTREDVRIVVAAEALQEITAEDIDIFKAVLDFHPLFVVRSPPLQ